MRSPCFGRPRIEPRNHHSANPGVIRKISNGVEDPADLLVRAYRIELAVPCCFHAFANQDPSQNSSHLRQLDVHDLQPRLSRPMLTPHRTSGGCFVVSAMFETGTGSLKLTVARGTSRCEQTLRKARGKLDAAFVHRIGSASGPKPTSLGRGGMSAFGGKADMMPKGRHFGL